MAICCDRLSTLFCGIASAVPRAKLAGIGCLVRGVPRGSWANRGPICGHVGLPVKTFNTPSQTNGPITLPRTLGLLAVAIGSLAQNFCTIFGGLNFLSPSYFSILASWPPPVFVPEFGLPSAFVRGVSWEPQLEAIRRGNHYSAGKTDAHVCDGVPRDVC